MTQLQLFHQLLANLQADPSSGDVPVLGISADGKVRPASLAYAQAGKDKRTVIVLQGK